jgi:hypothetical protein
VSTVGEDWNEATLTWNNAPLAVENVAAAWAGVFPQSPGEPREWDVSRAVAQAYAAGTPLRLALYESDWAYHSGKYFRSSETDEYEQWMRPTLSVSWGRALADLQKTVTPSFGHQGDPVTYTLDFVGTGSTLALTDTLPSGVNSPGNWELEGTSVLPVYDGDQHRLTWSDSPALGQAVVIRYTVSVTTDGHQVLVNTAELSAADGEPSTTTATVIANPYLAYLPAISRGQ